MPHSVTPVLAPLPPGSASQPGARVPATPAVPLRVALLEDDATVRQLLLQYLAQCPEFVCVAVAGTVAELWQELDVCLPPQLLLLDLDVPGQSGLAALPQLLARYPELHVVVQTNHDTPDVVYHALRCGARGFLVKCATPLTAYRQALLDVYAGGAYTSASVTRQLLQHFPPTPSRDKDLLSERERQVLASLLDGHTEKQMAHQLGLSPTTVRTYVERLYDKLKVANKGQLLARAAQGQL
ncbi:MAG: LuxR C-terminal-related transcriptional regulator [Janthinobacterium lividum]